MSNIKDLITVILNDEKLKNSKALNSAVYRDEPIIKTAAQLKRPETPSKLREMRNIAYSADAYWRSSDWLFYTQGKFMEDFEDVFEYKGEFIKYYPTYRDMTTDQLRGYFSWRTRVRYGVIKQTERSFVFVYIYELLNRIGTSSAEDGFLKLQAFWKKYREIDPYIDCYMKTWLTDYVIYYGLDVSLLANSEDIAFDNALLTLIHYESYGREEVFSALVSLSAYRIEASKFYIHYPEDVKAVVCGVFSELSKYYEKHRKKSFCENIFGRKVSCSYRMFRSAVFYDRMATRSCEYTVNEIHSYCCKNGNWTCEKFYGNRKRNGKLGAILKTVDTVMREKYNYQYKLKPEDVTKTVLNIIESEIESYLEHKRKNCVPKIEIDVSKLGGIRKAADITREKLIVDESFGEECYETSLAETVDQESLSDEPEPCANETLLNDTEYRFMQCLLYGGDYSSLIKERGVMLSVLADSVNEKLFNEFGDTVVDFSGDVPVLLEDYTDDLKGIIKQ